ncbi:MAG: chemotaxis protein CheD, partial [Desulfobacteraceae bacterium]|nr:chemotaxis protein CheD [Desulfobacteraceae bacterium]
AREPTLITTLLGSCVSVCLYNPRTKSGAMCHGVLPFCGSSSLKDSFHFVDSSIAYMVEVLGHQQKTIPGDLEAKLFGGANVLALAARIGKKGSTVGDQNIEAARASLRGHGVPIVVERVGGDRGCKLFFYANTGEVLMRSLRPQPPA